VDREATGEDKEREEKGQVKKGARQESSALLSGPGMIDDTSTKSMNKNAIGEKETT